MNLVDRYLGKILIQTTCVVLFGVIGIEIFISMITELSEIGRSHYTIFSAFAFVFMNLPAQLYNLFPLVGLIGMLMALGLLANHSELVILQGAGMSPFAIACSALKTIILMLIVVSFIGEGVAPKLTAYADSFKEIQLQNIAEAKMGLAYDQWVRVKNNYIYIKEINSERTLSGINWFQFDHEGHLIQTTLAKKAIYVNDQWLALDLQQTQFTPTQIYTRQIPKIILPLNMSPKILLNTNQNPSSLSLSDLKTSLIAHENNHSDTQAGQLNFWRRIIQPFSSLVMMLLAIPFVFGPLRQSSQGLRLVIGLAIGFSFYYANQFFGPITLLLHWPTWLGACLPTLLFSLVGVALLKWQKG